MRIVEPFLSENASLTTYFLRIKAKPLDEIKQNTYLCVILHVKHKQLPIFSVLTFWVKSEMVVKIANMFDDITGLW